MMNRPDKFSETGTGRGRPGYRAADQTGRGRPGYGEDRPGAAGLERGAAELQRRAAELPDGAAGQQGSDENLERLITRFLDREDSPADRQALNGRVDADPAARALLDDYIAIDNLAGRALRGAMSISIHPRKGLPHWFRIGRLASFAAAACLALLIYIAPVRPDEGGNGRQPARAGSLFAPVRWPDLTPQQPPAISTPHVRRENVRRDWILIPTDRPGEYMVVEVDRVTTRMRAIHRDF